MDDRDPFPGVEPERDPFARLAAASERRPAYSEFEDADEGPPNVEPTRFVLRPGAAIPPRRWLYARHLVAGFVSLTVAPGGVGKSSQAIVEALSMVTGRPLLDCGPPHPLRVWVWNGEDPKEEIERRVAAACMHHRVSAEQIDGRLFTDSGRDAPLCIATAGRDGVTVNRPAVEMMVDAIRSRRIDVVLVDPFATTHEAPENDNAAINAVVSAWREIADRTGAAIELIHHSQKAAHINGGELGVSQSRGASALIDGVRSARFVVAMTADEAAKAGMESPRGFFRVEMGKANLAPKPERSEWRRLASIALGNGSGSYPDGDFVGVVETWKWPDPFEGLGAETLEAVKGALADGEGRADEQASAWAGYRIAEALGMDVGERTGRSKAQTAARSRVKGMLSSWISSGALRRETRRSGRDGREIPFIIPGDGGDE